MEKDNSWFDVIQSRPYLYTIRERLDRVDSRFYTKYTNLYLLVGDHSAILFDTGTGIGNLHSLTNNIIGNKDLIVINSHNHFDHIGSNYQFEETRIHRLDFKKLMKPYPLDFLKGCNPEFESFFEKNQWKMNFASDTIPLIGNEIIDLGGITAKLMYLPGHTPGSIAMVTDNGELFTGDTLHYGAVYLPGADHMPYYMESLDEVGQFLLNNPHTKIFPGHEDFDLKPLLFDQMKTELTSIDPTSGYVDHFLEAKVIETENFIFIRPSPGFD